MNREVLIKLIKIASERSGIKVSVLEKDYYITNILRELSKSNENVIFKGGTCLSKAYKVVERFSEDVDITLKKEVVSQKNIRIFNKLIEEICYQRLGLKCYKEIQEKHPIRHKAMSNIYYLDYLPMANVDIKEYIELDSSFITKVEDAQKMIIKPMIQEILNINNEESLGEFEIYVQPIEMIIADKFFAICKNYRRGNVERYSRHFYDIYESYIKIIGKNQISKNNLSRYVREVAEAEKNKYSENENVEVLIMKNVLTDSINSKDYRIDYSKDLPKYIYGENMPTYDQCCEVIKKLVDDGLFDGINHYFIKKKKEKNKNEKIFIYEFVKKDISEIKNLTQQEMLHKYYDGDKKLAIQKIEELREKLLNKGKMFNKTKYYITKVEGFKDIYFIVGQNITRGIAVDIANIEIK